MFFSSSMKRSFLYLYITICISFWNLLNSILKRGFLLKLHDIQLWFCKFYLGDDVFRRLPVWLKYRSASYQARIWVVALVESVSDKKAIMIKIWKRECNWCKYFDEIIIQNKILKSTVVPAEIRVYMLFLFEKSK